MQLTKSALVPAIILRETSGPSGPDDVVYCMFNPNEFTVTKQNRYDSTIKKGKNIEKPEFRSGGKRSLSLQLFFDTFAEGVDVRSFTEPLWKMALVDEDKKNPRDKKGAPPVVEFRWGMFSFRAVITSLSQRFTLFNFDGTPLRTTVNVTFDQVADETDQPPQNPTSGNGPALRTHVVQAGERLDLIAAHVYGDATDWRRIADANQIHNPLRLRPGQQLIIPPQD
jgi:hypothetical protein